MSTPVIHDHDGHVDKFLSSLLLWLSPEIELQAIGITNGECYAKQAFEAMIKMATYLDLEGAEIAISEDPITNQFPDSWRKESYVINELPLFGETALKKPYQKGPGRKSQVVYADCLAHSKQKVTFVTTGPLTNIASFLQEHPKLKSKINEMIIMAGAIAVPGNVHQNGSDGAVEWNAYADPQALKFVLQSGIPIKLITLDVTNGLPVSKEFLQRLEEQADQHKASALAATLWSLVKGFEYYMWDTATAACAINPHLFKFKEMHINVATQGRNRGKTTSVIFGGRKLQASVSIDKDGFEQLLLRVFRTK